MAGIGTEDSSLLRAKLEFPVWYRSFTKSYTAWSNAPSDLKTPLLLSGPALAKAEIWLLACPEKLSDSQKRYIVRSISQKAREPSAGPNAVPLRGKAKSRWHRTSDRSLWHLYAVIALGIWVFAPEFVSDSMERALNTPEALEEIRRQRTLAEGGKPAIEAAQAKGPSAPSTPATDAPADVAAAETPPDSPEQSQAQTQTPPETTVVAETDPTPPERPAESMTASRADQLATLASAQLASGHHRQGLLLAIEAAEAARTTTEEQTGIPQAARPLVTALATRVTLAPLVATTRVARAALFCTNNSILVTPTAAAEASVWSETGRRIAVVSGLERGLNVAALDRECRRIAVPNEDFNIELRSVTGENRPVVLAGHEAGILHIAFSRDGTLAATASQDSTARVWDTRTGRQRALLSGHDWHVLSAEFSPDGKHVLTASADKTARIWDAATGKPVLALGGHQGSVTTATYSQDGRRILTVSWDGSVRVFDAATGNRIAALRHPGSNFASAALSPDGSHVATIDAEGHTSLWRLEATSAVESTKRQGTARHVVFSADSRWLNVLDWSGSAQLIAVENGSTVLTVGGAHDPLQAISFSSGEPVVVAVGRSGQRYSWPIVTSIESALAMGKAIAPPCLSADERVLLGLDGEPPSWCSHIRPRGAALPQ